MSHAHASSLETFNEEKIMKYTKLAKRQDLLHPVKYLKRKINLLKNHLGFSKG